MYQRRQVNQNFDSQQSAMNHSSQHRFGSNRDRIAMLTNSNSDQITHTVVNGDSYWQISQQYNVPLETVQAANNWASLFPGDVITFSRSGPTSSSNNVEQQAQPQPQQQQQQKQPESGQPQGYDPATGKALAQAAATEAGGRTRAGGRCYFHVANAVDRVMGRFLSGGHAYMAASQLAARKDLFVEVPATNLSSLPAGAIVVWGKGNSKSGHISISQGNGMETSDFIGAQMTTHYGGAPARVFLPKKR